MFVEKPLADRLAISAGFVRDCRNGPAFVAQADDRIEHLVPPRSASPLMIERVAGHSLGCWSFWRWILSIIIRQRASNFANELISPFHDGEHCIRTIAQHVPAISNLPSQRGTFARALGIAAGPIACDNLCAGVGLQPVGKGLALPIRQQVNDLVGLEIHQHGAVPLPLSPCPIVNAQDTRRTLVDLPISANDPKHRVSTDAHAQPLNETSTRFAAKG